MSDDDDPHSPLTIPHHLVDTTGQPLMTPEEQALEIDRAWFDVHTTPPSPAAPEGEPETVQDAPEVNATEVCAAAGLAAVRAYLQGTGEKATGIPPGWESLPETAREHFRMMANAACLGWPPERVHEAWVEHRAGLGWTYGPRINQETKEHPGMVPYDQLPPWQRMQNAVFRYAAREVALAMGAPVI